MKKKKDYVSNYSSYSDYKHRVNKDAYVGGGNYKKTKKQDADYFYNGHWDENYIDRYQSEEV